jgi:SOS-response transcriptional repressor LexA
MEIHELRLKALRWEIAKFPSIAAFARHYQLDVTYVSQLLNRHRNLGERAARSLEAKFGWPSLAMDFAENDWDAHGPETGQMASPAAPSRKKDYSRPFSTPSVREIPIISAVQAGLWREAVDAYAPGAGQDAVIVDSDPGPHAFALKVRGNSMEPDFREGDTIIIDPDVRPHPGDFVVARNQASEATFKKYRPRGFNDFGQEVIELVPLNVDYPTLRSDHSPIEIIGTLIEHRRYRQRQA